jgi:ribosome-binding protein aMBF1 (putative translation factor)
MKKARIDKDNLLVSRSVAEASERLLKRVDDAVAADPKLTAKVEAIMLEAQIALKLEEARKTCGLSQQELAARMGTSQPQIARLERQGYTGSLRTLAEFAAACGKKLIINLE